MAIKPSDCIVPIGALRNWVQVRDNTSGWAYEQVFKVKYLKNFADHLDALTTQYRKANPAHVRDAETIVRDTELARFNAIYRMNKFDSTKDYIKFKSHADLTFFMLKWS